MNLEPVMRERLAGLAPESLEIIDQSAAPGGNTHWRVAIVSRAFAGKPSVARHRMVYAALGELMNNPIHAVQIHALAPGEAGT